MADGTTVDSLQIEIEASSAEAEKRVDALAAALERLKKATTGFGNISDRIRDIGASASESGPAEKTRRRKEALDRAAKPENFTVSANVDLDKAGSQLEATDRKIEKAKESIAELNEQIRMLGFAHDKKQGEEAIAQLNEELSRQQGILDSLIEKREKLSSMIVNGTAKEPKQTGDQWADVKAQLKGSTLGDLVGDTRSVDEAVSRMVDLNDQVSLLNVKLEGLQEKLRGAFEKGNQSQVASYTAQIQKLKDQIAQLQNAPEQAKDSKIGMVKPEESLEQKLGILQRISDTISKISGTKIKIDIGKEISEVLNNIASKKVREIVPKGADTTIKALEGAFGGLTKKMIGFAAAHPAVAAALLSVGVAAKTVVKSFKSFSQTAGAAAKNVFDLLASGAKKLTSALKNLVTTGIGKAVSGLKSIGKSVVKNITAPFTKSFEKISRWKKMLGSALFYSTVFRGMSLISNGIKEGITNLYEYSRLAGTEFAPAMNSLATSALYLKNSLGAMAAPLIQALAPVVDMLIDKFVALINVIGKAFAMLTGKSVYTQAKKHAVEYGEAANKASKATKDFLLGIDELNVINDTAGGGGGAASDFGSMFEEVEIDQDQFDWVKQIREAIENGEWRSVGKLVANKLNEVVDGWDSYAWGAKLGGLLNNGLNVAYGFLTTFDFKKFGSKVANGLNGLFDTVDWDLLGRTFAAKWNALFDFIYGFATTLKWHEIGLDISQAINGFLDELDPSKAARAVSAFVTGLFDMLNTAIAETNWNVLGDKLGQFISEVDWQGAIYGALSIITNSLNALKKAIDAFLKKWEWKDMAKQVYDSINKAWNDVDWPGLGKTLGDLVITALKFAIEVISNIDWPKIGRDIGNFLISIDWVKVFGGLTDVIAAGITSAVGALGGLIDTIAPKMKEIATGVAQKVNEFFDKIDWAETGHVLSKGIESALDFMITFMQKVDWDSIGRHIAEFLENIEWDTLLTKWGQLLGEFMTAKMKLIDVSGILEVGANIVKGLWDGWWAEWEAGGGILGWLKREFLDKFLGAIKELFGIHSPSTVMAEIGGFLIEGLLQGIKDTWNSIVEFFQNAFGPIISVITGAWDIVKNLTSGNFAEVGRIISDAWSNVQSDSDSKLKKFVSDTGASYKALHGETENKFEEIRRSISTSWGETEADTKQKWSEINSSLNGTWDSLRSNADTRFSGVKQTVAGAWSEIETKTDSSWSSASSTIREKMGEIKNSIEKPFTGSDGLISKASTWGRDLVKNLADGMERNKNLVDNAARMTARGISSYLHFSEPDVGPLSDFHTYMPDMLELMSKGIKDNTYKAVNAASQLADCVSGVLGNVEPVQPKFASYPTPQFTEAYSASQMVGSSISNYSAQDSSAGNNDFSSAIYAAAGMIVEAIQNQDNSVYLDGKQLMKSVERSQKERGANIMAGGVML